MSCAPGPPSPKEKFLLRKVCISIMSWFPFPRCWKRLSYFVSFIPAFFFFLLLLFAWHFITGASFFILLRFLGWVFTGFKLFHWSLSILLVYHSGLC